MRIFLTGATGFLGRTLLARLIAAGHEIHALARTQAAAKALTQAGATPHQGSLAALPPLPQIEATIHAAALLRMSGPAQLFHETNVAGTEAILAASRRAGATRFIHIGAAAVVMDAAGTPLDNVTEAAPTFPDSPIPYVASKSRAEALVRAANDRGFTTIALRPPGIWGPGDRFEVALRGGRFAFIDRGDYPYVTCHAENVAHATLRALEAGQGGAAYFINDPAQIRFRDFVLRRAAALGLDPARALSIPYGAAATLGRTLEGAWSRLRLPGEPPLSATMVRLIGRAFTTSDAAARADLLYRPRDHA